jgi:hypothetical protein
MFREGTFSESCRRLKRAKSFFDPQLGYFFSVPVLAAASGSRSPAPSSPEDLAVGLPVPCFPLPESACTTYIPSFDLSGNPYTAP